MAQTSNQANPTTSTDHAGEPPTVLEPDATVDDVELGDRLLGTVNGTTGYGVFVKLTPSYGTDFDALAHSSSLPPLNTPRDYKQGERVVVDVESYQNDGEDIGVTIVAKAPDYDGELPDVDPSDNERVTDGTVPTEEGEQARIDPRDMNEELGIDRDKLETINDRLAELEALVADDTEPGTEIDASLVDVSKRLLDHHTDGATVETVYLDDNADTTTYTITLQRP